jgi:hypothetical protein
LIVALTTPGKHERVHEWFGRAVLLDPNNLNMPCNIAGMLNGNGHDLDGGLRLPAPLFKVFRTGALNWKRTDPEMSPGRADPRFQALCAKAELRRTETAQHQSRPSRPPHVGGGPYPRPPSARGGRDMELTHAGHSVDAFRRYTGHLEGWRPAGPLTVCRMGKWVGSKSTWIVALLGAMVLCAGAPAWALVADGLTYTLFESVVTPTEDQFTLTITGINGPTDTEGGRYGVNSLAFNETSPSGSLVTGTLTGFAYMTGGLSAMGCDGSGNFFCFKANTAPTSPALPANSSLTFTFYLTVTDASAFNGYNPAFKIQWLGSKPGKYDLVSQTLTPTPVPLPAALPLLFGGVAGLRLMRRRRQTG